MSRNKQTSGVRFRLKCVSGLNSTCRFNFYEISKYLTILRSTSTKYLRSYEIAFYALFVCGHYFFQCGFIWVYIFYLLFWENSFTSFCVWYVFYLFWVLNSTSYLGNYKIYSIYRIIVGISAIWPSVNLFSLYKNDFSL